MINFLKKIKNFVRIDFLEIFFLLLCIIIYPGPTFYGHDELYYFDQLISIMEDGDLEIYNNLAKFPLNVYIRNNYYSIGPAIYWSPFYVLGHIIFNINISIFPSIINLYPADILIFGLDVALANIETIFYTYVGLKILGKALVKYFNKDFSPLIVQFLF